MRSRLLITSLIIILLVVYAYFGMDYIKQRQEHEVLFSQITEVTQTLRQISKPPQDMAQRLAAAQASLAAEQSAFPGKINSAEVVNTILKLADDAEVKAIPLVTQPWSMENAGEHDYYVFRLNVTVEGSFSQLVSFVSQLENGKFKTLIVEDLSITGVTEPEGTIPVTARLDLAIYTQSPTSD